MFYPYGFSGSSWLLYIGVPLIIGLWAQFRVSSAFRKWGEVRASSNITGSECAREILQAAQIHDVDVVETNNFLGTITIRGTRNCTFRVMFITRRRWRRWVLLRTRPVTPFSTPGRMRH